MCRRTIADAETLEGAAGVAGKDLSLGVALEPAAVRFRQESILVPVTEASDQHDGIRVVVAVATPAGVGSGAEGTSGAVEPVIVSR